MDNTTSERWFCFNSLDKKTLSFCNLRGILSRNISIKYVENWLNTYSLILLCSSQINIVSLLILGILPTSKILFGTAVWLMDSGFMVSWNENQKVARKLIFSCIFPKKTVPWNGHSWVILPSQEPEGISKDANNIIHTSWKNKQVLFYAQGRGA